MSFLSDKSCAIFSNSIAPHLVGSPSSSQNSQHFQKALNLFIQLCEILLAGLIVLIFIYKILRYINKFEANISKNALKSHKNLTVSLIVQVSLKRWCEKMWSWGKQIKFSGTNKKCVFFESDVLIFAHHRDETKN